MRSGVSTFTYSDTATFAAITGSVSSDYPIGNLSDLVVPSKVARITPSGGAVAFSAVLAADATVQMAALVNHTLPAGATVHIRFYSDSGLSSLVTGGDLGPTAIPTAVSGYRQAFPAVMAAARTVRGVRVDIGSAGADPIDIGGLEIAQWWEWPWITADADLGFTDSAEDIELLGGGAWGREEYRPNTYSGQVRYMDSSDALTKGVDFQKLKGLARQFVFVEDYADPTTWPRTCFLAVNSDLSPLVADLYDRDTFPFRLREHVR